MSNILTKAVKNVKILCEIVTLILAAAIAVGIVCGINGWGVFNKDALLNDTQTMTVSVNHFLYQTNLEKVEDVCEEVLKDSKIVYEIKGEMSGDDSEIVYVFDKDADLTEAKAALESKFADLIATDAEWQGTFVTVALNSEEAVAFLAQNYVLRGVIAGVALAVLVFAYVAIRYGLYMGIVGGVSTLLGTALTTAMAIVTRIPVTSSVIYVIAAGALLTAVMTVISLNKIREGEKEGAGEAEDVVAASLATNEILTLAALMAGAFVLMGAVAMGAGVRWFAILALIALAVAVFIGLAFAPALYVPFKVLKDNKPVEGAYVGAEKTSTKVKKTFEKKAKKEVIVELRPVSKEEAPVEEETEEAVEETVTEEAEEVVEETPVEEATEEPVAEEAVEEAPAEEVIEEAPVEAPVEETEEKQE